MTQSSTQIATDVFPGSQQGNAIRDLAANVAIVEAALAQASTPYKVWMGTLKPNGANPPTATVLLNTLGENITWLRDAEGCYTAHLGTTGFNEDKTIVIATSGYGAWGGNISTVGVEVIPTVENAPYNNHPLRVNVKSLAGSSTDNWGQAIGFVIFVFP